MTTNTAFLQIFHISDLHVNEGFESTRLRQIARLQDHRWMPERLGRAIRDKVLEGIAPHDPQAPRFFEAFLRRVRDLDDWKDVDTWVVDTGDLTTFGDTESWNAGDGWRRAFYVAARAQQAAWLHGNHDMWPEGEPWLGLRDRARAEKHASTLRTRSPRFWPLPGPPLRRRPTAPHHPDVQLFTIETVVDDAFDNTRALGHVTDEQLYDLEALVERHAPTSGRAVRILAIHHPLQYPADMGRRDATTMVLKNATEVSDRLCGAGSRIKPLVHLILSGHTHSLHPLPDALPEQTRDEAQPLLGVDQCQFVTGSLLQARPRGVGVLAPTTPDLRMARRPHQCVALRLHVDPEQPELLRIRRMVAARRTREEATETEPGATTGDFRFLRTPEERAYEEITLYLRSCRSA